MMVNLKDPDVQAKVKAAGIRWRMKDFEHGLELTEQQAISAGLSTKAKAVAKAPEPEAPTAETFHVPPQRGRIFGKK